MKKLRILLAEDDPITRIDIKETLEEEGFIVVGECWDGESAVNLARCLKPDLVLMDIKMPVMNGLQAAAVINEENIAPVLLLTAYSSADFISKATAAGVLAYLVKPVAKSTLIPACYIAVNRYEEFDILRGEINNLKEALEARKVIEKAKGLLQKKYLLNEEKAFKKIRKISMDQNIPMKDVAEAIILSLSSKNQ
ncbi:ANTAR domain-containing response regulator [Desulfitibacter alkalitolerans]|uniref:ANTAR domain-containing response regulator n=1 Tax=Desulfitibacter alkalitolerans TaxID=264641 RepID=UPI00055855DF|nr:response regulator [Desulfitibacter alkalitolerans]